MCATSLQSCTTLCNPVDSSLPGSSVHGILQARILEWVATPSSRGIFLTHRQNPCLLCLLHWLVGSLPSVLRGKLKIAYYSFLRTLNLYFYILNLPLEKEMATHSSILAWEIPRVEEPGGLQSMGSQRVRLDWAISLSLSHIKPWTRKTINPPPQPHQLSTSKLHISQLCFCILCSKSIHLVQEHQVFQAVWKARYYWLLITQFAWGN